MDNSSVDFELDLSRAVDCLMTGGIILYPTDTIWGIGCDAGNPEAVKKIYELKQRSDEKSMLVLVSDLGMLQEIVEEVPETACRLMETIENPLTIIYNRPKNVASNLKSDDDTLGIRITDEKFSKELCRRLNRPIVSTSANISGETSPKNFREISDRIKEGVDYVVKYRQDDLTPSSPSNIIKLEPQGKYIVLR